MKNSAVAIMIFLLLITITAQDKYPVGAYLLGRPDRPTAPPLYENYSRIKDAGINTIIQYSITENDGQYLTNKDSLLQFENLIPVNANRQTDYIYHYTAGMYSKWEAEQHETNSNKVGIKHEFGIKVTFPDENVECWYSGINPDNIGRKLIHGPDYLQYKTYPLFYKGSKIKYNLRIRMKKGYPTNVNENVCRVIVQDYKGDSLLVRDINENELSSSWSSGSVIEVGSYYHDTTQTNTSQSDPYGKMISIDEEMRSGIEGVKYIVEWLTDIPIYIDYIEVYDEDIWGEYLSLSSQVISKILNYANKFSNWGNVKYWYSLDEPHSIDSHIPYKTIDGILKANGYPGLITAFYPGWDGQRDGVNSIKLFTEGIEEQNLSAEPEKLMIDYYPYWPQITNFSSKVTDMKTILTNAHEQDKDFWFVAQAMEFREGVDNSTIVRRRPTRQEFRAQVNYALGFGAKGIIFWPYYSYWETSSEGIRYKRAYAIEDDPNDMGIYEKTDLWYELKGIGNMLNNDLGDKLKNAEYSGLHAQNTIDYNVGFLNIFPDMNNMFSSNILESRTDNDIKYFSVVNCNTDTISGNNRIVEIEVNLSDFQNWHIDKINDSNPSIKVTSNHSFMDTLDAGEGNFYELIPLAKYGGTLITNEIINTTNDTLKGILRIPTSMELMVNKPYVIEEDIHIESEGKIKVGIGGAITKEGGKVTSQRWEDLFYINQNGSNPKLVWSVNNNYTYTIRYNVWRKKYTQSYEKIAVINDKI